MERNEDNITDVHMRKVVTRAWEKMLKTLESEPSRIIIEQDNTQDGLSEDTLNEIRAWLFRRRQENGNYRN